VKAAKLVSCYQELCCGAELKYGKHLNTFIIVLCVLCTIIDLHVHTVIFGVLYVDNN